MQIEIGEYVITSDTYNLILNEKKVAKEGKSAGEERLQSIGFYSKISTLISALIQREVLLSDVQSLQAMQAALNQHQDKYGDYAPSKESENYTVLVDGMKIVVEIMNRKKSYVATSMMRPRDLSKVWGNAA